MRHPGLLLLLICLLVTLGPQVSGFPQGRAGCPIPTSDKCSYGAQDQCQFDFNCGRSQLCCNNGCNKVCSGSSDYSWFYAMNPFHWSAYGPFF